MKHNPVLKHSLLGLQIQLPQLNWVQLSHLLTQCGTRSHFEARLTDLKFNSVFKTSKHIFPVWPEANYFLF